MKTVVKTTQLTTPTTGPCPVLTACIMIPWTTVTIWTEGNKMQSNLSFKQC